MIVITGAVTSTVKLAEVLVAALFPVASLTLAVIVYVAPSVSACKPAALIVTVVALLVTVLVYVAPFKVIVTNCPSSTPVVVTETVPSELSSVAFNTAPQEKAPVPIAAIDGDVLSNVTLPEPVVTGIPGFPAISANDIL